METLHENKIPGSFVTWYTWVTDFLSTGSPHIWIFSLLIACICLIYTSLAIQATFPKCLPYAYLMLYHSQDTRSPNSVHRIKFCFLYTGEESQCPCKYHQFPFIAVIFSEPHLRQTTGHVDQKHLRMSSLTLETYLLALLCTHTHIRMYLGRLVFKICYLGPCQKAQWVKVLAGKPDEQNLICWAHMVVGESWLSQTVLWPLYTCCDMHIHTHT